MTAATVRVLHPSSSIDALQEFRSHMETAKFSTETIDARLELLARLAKFLGSTGLLDAAPTQLEAFQQSYSHLARASVDIYSRHVFAFYKWATATERVARNPVGRMVVIAARRGVPHPIKVEDLRILLACARGSLRLAYVLAAFAGLRRGEICKLRSEDLSLDAAQPVALIHGKGDKERIIPLLPPVVAELRALNLPRRGLAVLDDGKPYDPERLSLDSYHFMRELGIESTLHSLRHYFATEVVKLTRDVLLVRDLLGHSSIATTQIYMQSSIEGAQDRLAAFSGDATALIANERAP